MFGFEKYRKEKKILRKIIFLCLFQYKKYEYIYI